MHSPQIFLNKYIIEEKSLRHVTMVAKFLDDNKPKTSLKKWNRTVSDFIDLSFILSNVGEIFWGWIQKALTYFTYSIKQASEIEKFHVAIVQQRLRNVQKGVMHVLKLLLFCRSRCRRRRRGLDFKKSGYHGNVTSHFSKFPQLGWPRIETGCYREKSS